MAAPPKKPPRRPAAGFDPRLALAVAVGGGLAVILLVLFAAAAVSAFLSYRTAHRPAPAVVVALPEPANPPAADPPADPPPAPEATPASMPPVAAAPQHEPSPLRQAVEPPGWKVAPPELEPRPTAAPPSPEKPLTPDEKVDRAVARAVAYLKGEVAKDLRGDGFPGKRTGVMALVGLALLESGVPADDADVQKAAKEVRAGAEGLTGVYQMSLCVWFLDRLGDPQDEEAIRSLAARLMAGQLASGLWDYECPAAKPERQKHLMEVLAKHDVGSPIPGAGDLPPVCQYYRGKRVEAAKPAAPGAAGPPKVFGPSPPTGDLSLTQFAVLALWAARKHTVPVDRSLLLTEAHCREAQAGDGSWGYRGDLMRDSMTCAGLMALAVGRGVEPPKGVKPPAFDPALDRALRFVADVFARAVPAPEKDKLDALRNVVSALRVAYGGPLWKFVGGKKEAVAPADAEKFEAAVQEALDEDLPGDSRERLREVMNAAKAYAEARSVRRRDELAAALDTFMGGSSLGQGDRFLKARPPVDSTWDDIYFLWSLERMAVVCDFQTVAGRDWYGWGADLLVAYQRDDGSWVNAYSGVVDTSLALLFLKRANVAKDLTARIKAVAPFQELPLGTTLKSSGESLNGSPGERPAMAPDPAQDRVTPKP